MSSLSDIITALSRPGAVAFLPPSSRLVDQDALHDLGTRLASTRPDIRGYLGWPWPLHAFTAAGEWREPVQYVFWGGDADAVRQHLETALAPLGVAVTGGTLREAPFVLAPDVAPAGLTDTDAWATRLPQLTLTRPLAPLRPGEEDALHALVAGPAPEPLRDQAATALGLRDLIIPGDLDAALAPDAPTGAAWSPLVLAAADDPRARVAADRLIAAGTASLAVRQRFAPDDTRRERYDAALAGDTGAARDFFAQSDAAGADPVTTRRDLLDALIAAGAPESMLSYVTGALSNVLPGGVLGVLGLDLPLHVRLLVAASADGRGHTAWGELTARDPEWPPLTPEWRAVLERTCAGWDDAVDAVRAEAGLPPHPGVTLRSPRASDLEGMEHLIHRHGAGLRAVFADPEASERRIAVALAILDASPEPVTAADLEPLRRGWRKRVLVKKADDYAPGLPAVVGMLRVLRREGNPWAEEIAAVVAQDTRAFMAATRGYVAALTDPLEEVWQRTAADRMGDAVPTFLLASPDALGATLEHWDQIARTTRGARKAVAWSISRRAYGTDLLGGSFDTHSPRQLDAALHLAEDALLPRAVRVQAAAAVRDSVVLDPARRSTEYYLSQEMAHDLSARSRRVAAEFGA